MPFTPRFLATAIGSMPHQTPEAALDVVFAAVPHAPIWPQLPRTGLKEQMEVQYCEGMPRAVIDEEKRRLFFDTSGDTSEDLAAFYETYLPAMDPDEGTGDCSAMALGQDHATGFYALVDRLRGLGKKLPFVKVQTTGPVSFSLTIVDENKRALYYNEEFRDMVVKAMAMKSRWQIQTVKPFADNVICFIDEPILSAFGSSTYVSVTRDDVVAMLGEVADAVRMDGGIPGAHCCGNTEWSILVDAGVDIVNFDAYEYGETIAMYPDAVNQLFARHGALAWGIVPSSTAVRGETAASLADRLEGLMDLLASKGVDRKAIVDQAIITSSCGTGSLDVADAERIFALIGETSALLRARYGFTD
ncbi:MAG: hypothetical protein AB7E47_12740 [Desulfovibrionaceae bacterium]